ncbi:hypothetical protein [Flavobacterium sp.]|uniref:hypothetical protein n=1 Tax=Flavobacterium sp. TaxID=239 RepID=UPI002EDB2B58
MKKIFKTALILAYLTLSNTYAQIGVPNNNPNKDAVLDLNNTNGTSSKGLLLPQVSLISTTSSLPLSTNVAGMHIYNTATAGSGTTQVKPGEYSNDGTSWKMIQTTGWGLQGNANTTTSNFIGTTDAVDFPIRTNNTERLRVTSAGKLLLGTTTVPTGGTNPKVILNNGTTTGAIQLKDGTEGNNFILTSDANGVGTWKAQTLDVFFAQNFGAGAYISYNQLNKWYNTGTTITLPAGKWLLSITMLINKDVVNGTYWTTPTESWWVNTSFSDSNTTLNYSADLIGGKIASGVLPPNSPFNILTGSIIINNTSGANKNYYFMANVYSAVGGSGQLRGFGGSSGENNISWKAID